MNIDNKFLMLYKKIYTYYTCRPPNNARASSLEFQACQLPMLSENDNT